MFKQLLLQTQRLLPFLILAVPAFSNPKRTPSLQLTCTSHRSECLLVGSWRFMDVYSTSFWMLTRIAWVYIYHIEYRFLVIPSYPRLSRSLQNRQAYCSRHGYGLVMALGLAPFGKWNMLGRWMEYDGNGGVRKLGQVTEEQRMEIK